MADRRFLTLRKTIMFYICIGNFFLLFGCAKTEMVSEDNTVTNENIVSTTGTIVIETETQDAIQPSSDQPPEATPEYKIIMVGDVLLHTPVEESCLRPDGSYDYDSLFSHTKEEIAAADLALVNQVAADIQRAEELADFTIVCPHWGTEYRLTSDASQEKWTKIFAENGADLVLGTHPHVIEPIEWVTDEASEHEMLVYYSLGNFVNWTSGTGEGVTNRMVGGMAEVTITKNDHGEVEIADYGVKPMISHVASGPEGVTTYFLEDYPEELAEENEIVSQDPEFSREYCVNLCDSIWGDLWKAE